jgi:hypothetical protein
MLSIRSLLICFLALVEFDKRKIEHFYTIVVLNALFCLNFLAGSAKTTLEHEGMQWPDPDGVFAIVPSSMPGHG